MMRSRLEQYASVLSAITQIRQLRMNPIKTKIMLISGINSIVFDELAKVLLKKEHVVIVNQPVKKPTLAVYAVTPKGVQLKKLIKQARQELDLLTVDEF
jgi:predicted transcriptional regulator